MSSLLSGVYEWFSDTLVHDPHAWRTNCTTFVAALAAFAARSRGRRDLRASVEASATYVAVVLLASYAFVTGSYLFIAAYNDHIEPNFVVLSSLVLAKRSIYPRWESGESLYGTLYGPLPYLVNALPLLIHKSIASTKVPGVLAIWTTIALAIFEVRRTVKERALEALVVGGVVLYLFKFLLFTYWNRCDPFLLLAAAASISALRLPRALAPLAVGLAAGAATGLKVHGFLYVVPAAAALVARQTSRGQMLRVTLVMGVTAFVATAVPFLHPAASVSVLLRYLAIGARHGISGRILVDNASAATLIVVPPAMMLFARGRPRGRELVVLASSFFVASAMATVIGAKPGSGPHHVLPFLPSAVHVALSARSAEQGDGARSRWGVRARAASFFAAAIFALGPCWAVGTFEAWSRIRGPRIEEAALVELERIYDAHPAAEMGVAGHATYPLTFLRVIGAFRGAPVHMDVPTWMELHAAGISVETPEPLVERCIVAEWILPHGEPFTLTTYYPGPRPPLFSDRFRRAFHEQYEMKEPGRFYDVWSCHGAKSR